MKLPLLLSVPHGGLRVPEEVEAHCILTPEQIREDGDEGASAVYSIAERVEAFVSTDVARAIVDLNRAEDDRRPDGVVKTHTCMNVPVYDPFPPESLIEKLLERYYRPYHRRLAELARSTARLGIDCHTMLAVGPPIGPMAGLERPAVCLSNVDGSTCAREWFESLAACLEDSLGVGVSLNDPFKGGFITRTHAAEMPWVQIELSRAPFLSIEEKRERILDAFASFCDATGL